MTPLVFVLLALAGGVGAGARFLVDGLVRSRVSTAFPWPTVVVNLSGSLALGVLTGLVVGQVASDEVAAVVGAGFLGGYTTFSTASYETVQLVRQGRYGVALASSLGVLAACVVLAWLGYRWGVTR